MFVIGVGFEVGMEGDAGSVPSIHFCCTCICARRRLDCTVPFDDGKSQTATMVAPVGDVGNGGGVVAKGLTIELGTDGLVFVVEPEEHEEKLDVGDEGCLRFIKKC